MKRYKLTSQQRKMLLFWFCFVSFAATAFITSASVYLIADKKNEQLSWDYYFTEADTYTEAEIAASANAAKLTTGTYVERLDSVDIKNSKYAVTFKCWFNWSGFDDLDMEHRFELYEGTIKNIVKKDEHRENGNNYQLFEVTADVSKEFGTKRFPLGSYQLRLYLKPLDNIEHIVLIPDKENSGINPKLNAAGFSLDRSGTALFIHRRSADAEGAYYKGGGTESYSEVLTAMELKRNSIGLYLKCIIALIGTGIWALITLYICAHHQTDSLGMMPAILIGTVTNLMIGANLVPDALHTGLLEFINVWGIYTVLIATVLIVVINRIRSKYNESGFAEFFGKILFYTVLITTVLGHIILPLSAFQF